MDPIEWFILALIVAAMIPLGLSIFFYVTVPSRGRRWVRKPSSLFMQTPIGQAYLSQKIVLFTLFSWIGIRRVFGDFTGYELVANILFISLVIVIWRFFLVQRSVQRSVEETIRRSRGTDSKE